MTIILTRIDANQANIRHFIKSRNLLRIQFYVRESSKIWQKVRQNILFIFSRIKQKIKIVRQSIPSKSPIQISISKIKIVSDGCDKWEKSVSLKGKYCVHMKNHVLNAKIYFKEKVTY